MRILVRTAVLIGLLGSVHGQMRLPESRYLAGPFDSVRSGFGDEFYNFPEIFGGRAEPGSTFLSGWIRIEFEEPEEGYARFKMTLNTVGTPDGIAFPGGQTYTLNDNKALTNPGFASGGRVNLQTGEVDELEMHAIFQNSVIARVTKNIRIPFGFINDYPPTQLPLDLPFDDDPRVFEEAQFYFSSDGTITGFEFHGETIAPVTLFPRLGIFPPYSFGEDGTFYFANPDGCLPDAPPENCINDENNPDGVALAQSAFFHPHFDLITNELREVPAEEPSPDCALNSTADSNGLVAVAGRLYLLGGDEDRRRTGMVQVFDPENGSWETTSPIPVPVLDGQSAALGSRIFLMGGRVVPGSELTGELQVFDTASAEWSLLTSAPAPVRSAVAATVGERLYFIGGFEKEPGGTDRLTGRVQIYHPPTDTWTAGSDAPVPVANAAVGVVNGLIYLINGQVEEGFVTNEVWIYDTARNLWQTGPRTVVGVVGAVAAHVSGRVYLFGGRSSIEGPTERLLQILVLESNAWRLGLEPMIASADSAAALLGGKFYIAGGRIQTGLDLFPGAASDVLQVYDPGGGWSVCGSRPVFTSSDVLSAACGVAGSLDLSPGARAVILGSNFADSTRTAPNIRWNGSVYTADLPTELNGVRVSVDGKAAALVSVGPSLVEFQVPYSVEASSKLRRMVNLELNRRDARKQQDPVRVPVLAAAPKIYVYTFGDYRSAGYVDEATAQARNADGFINHPDHPAVPGERVTLYATGLGLVNPELADGQRAGDEPPNRPLFVPEVLIGGLSAEVVSVRMTAHEAGIYLIEVVIPSDVSTSANVPVLVSVNGLTSNKARISIR